MTSQPHARPTNVRWRIVLLLLASSFMSWFNRVSMAVAYDEQIKDQLDISEQAIGIVYSTFLFAYMIFMTPGGWFSDRLGPWLALALMGIGSGFLGALTGLPGLLLLPASQAVFMLLGIRALMGVFTAPIYPASGRIIAHWLPRHQRAMANGLVMGAALVGIAATYQGFGSLLDRLSWPAAFLLTGTVTVIVGAVWTWYGRDYPVQHPGVNEAENNWVLGRHPGLEEAITRAPEMMQPRAWSETEDLRGSDQLASAFTTKPETVLPDADTSWLALLKNRSLVLLTLSYAAVGYFEYLFYFWIHHYFEDVLELGKVASRNYAMITTLSMAAGMAAGGWISDRLQVSLGLRWGRALVPIAGMLLGAGLLFAGLAAKEPKWIVTWFALAMAAVGATEGPFWATALDIGGRRGATSAGIFNTGGNIGGLLAPTITPMVSDAWGWEWGIGLGSVVCLAGVCFWLWIEPATHLNGRGPP